MLTIPTTPLPPKVPRSGGWADVPLARVERRDVRVKGEPRTVDTTFVRAQAIVADHTRPAIVNLGSTSFEDAVHAAAAMSAEALGKVTGAYAREGWDARNDARVAVALLRQGEGPYHAAYLGSTVTSEVNGVLKPFEVPLQYGLISNGHWRVEVGGAARLHPEVEAVVTANGFNDLRNTEVEVPDMSGDPSRSKHVSGSLV